MQDTENKTIKPKDILITTQEKLSELFKMAIVVNQETHFCVFVKYSGHVNMVNFSFRLGKETAYDWEAYFCKDIDFYTDETWDDATERKYIKAKAIMQELLETEEITFYSASFQVPSSIVSKTSDNIEDRKRWMEDIQKEFKETLDFTLTSTSRRGKRETDYAD